MLFQTLPKGYTVTASYIEVYNDSVNDCLGSDKGKYLALRETTAGHVAPDGLTMVPVSDTAGVMKTLGKGDKNRVVAAMAMNPRSSRGHGLICLDVFNTESQPAGRLTLVDLAGMESSKKSAAVDGTHLTGHLLASSSHLLALRDPLYGAPSLLLSFAASLLLSHAPSLLAFLTLRWRGP